MAVRKLSVEEMHSIASRQFNRIRRQIAARHFLLSPEMMEGVARLFRVPRVVKEPAQNFASHYEVGQKFVASHLLEALHLKLQLSPAERRLVKTFFGRVYHCPPAREYERRALAAEKLSALGKRGKTLFALLAKEANQVLKIRKKADLRVLMPSGRDDLFTNPAFTYVEELRQGGSFTGVAALFRQQGEEKPTYH